MHRFQSLRPYTPPKDVLDIFLREFDAAYEAGGLFQLTMHPHIITARSRIWILDEIIRHAKSKGDVWFATHARSRGIRQRSLTPSPANGRGSTSGEPMIICLRRGTCPAAMCAASNFTLFRQRKRPP